MKNELFYSNITKLERKLFETAVELSKDNQRNEFGAYNSHISFAVKSNRVIATGLNNTAKGSPIGAKYGTLFNSIHSEHALWQKLRHHDIDWANLSIYNFRIGGFKKNEPRLAKPCSCCSRFLIDLGVKRIKFSTDTNIETLHFNR